MRQFSLVSIAQMSDEDAFDSLRVLRWEDNDGRPVCPRCGFRGLHYWLDKRKLWDCKSCRYQYTVTSQTIFASRKMPLKSIILGAAIYSGAAKGISACQLSRYLNIQYATAYLMAQKFREVIQRPDLCLDGIVEIDGCTVGGHRVFNNVLSYRQEKGRLGERIRRYKKNFNNRRVVVGIRQKHNSEMNGPGLTRCFVVRKESEALDHTRRWIADGAVVHADMAHAWASMKKLYRLLQVNHSQEAYVSNEGVHTNNIESFWALLRKMHYGTHHHISAKYLDLYANELAWRQDNRALSESERITQILKLALAAEPSKRWVGYNSPKLSSQKRLPLRRQYDQAYHVKAFLKDQKDKRRIALIVEKQAEERRRVKNDHHVFAYIGALDIREAA